MTVEAKNVKMLNIEMKNPSELVAVLEQSLEGHISVEIENGPKRVMREKRDMSIVKES